MIEFRAMSESESRRRKVRSFVRREGRMTRGQQRAFDEIWPRWGLSLPDNGVLDLSSVFGDIRPVWLEIGFGNGENLLSLAEGNPARNFLGVEVHRPGVGHLLLELESRGIENVRVMTDDALDVTAALPERALDGVLLLFPDPWHKKKHHKRRILQPEFVTALARIMRPNGYFHAATDWEDYARHMMKVLSESNEFDNSQGRGRFAPRPEDRPATRFELRGRRLGHSVYDLVFRRRA
jgi:tRNA (guanine-N7-)-methyltransferase